MNTNNIISSKNKNNLKILNTNNITNSKIIKILDTNNITISKIIKILNTNNITNMSNNNNKQLKFNSGVYKGKTYKEISEDVEGLNNIFKSNSPGYNKFKICFSLIYSTIKF